LAVGSARSRAAADDDLDFLLDAESSFVAYEIRSPGTAAFLARRRLVQSVGATYRRSFDPDEPLAVSASLRLRLDHDFGDTCLVARELCIRATDASDPNVFQPLARSVFVDAPEAWIELSGAPLGARVRLGRQLDVRTFDFVRFDGASVRLAPFDLLAVEGYGGVLVRSTSFFGSSAFEPIGSIRLERDNLSEDRAPHVLPPVTTWVAGAGLELGASRYVRARFGFRETFEEEGLVARRVSLALASQPIDALRLTAEGVLDGFDGTVTDVGANVAVEPADEWFFEAGFTHRVPRFDLGSVWAYFDVAPISDVTVRGELRPSDRLSLGLSVSGRRADLGATEDYDAGAGAYATARVLGFRLSLDAAGWGGELGPLASVLIGAERRFATWFSADLRASVWYFEDPLRQDYFGASFSEALGATFDLSESTHLRGDLEHAYSRVVGHRFRALVSLDIEVWR
jgi:hypothetical protein